MGHELDGDVTPIDTGLDFATRKSGGFIGAEALANQKEQGATSRIISLLIDDVGAVPLGHEPIYLGDTIIGQTTSAAFGFRVQRPVALAMVKEPVASGADVRVDIAGKMFTAKAIIGPLFDPDGSRMRA
jgi:glycine cleavage system aminomethyltransferase T